MAATSEGREFARRVFEQAVARGDLNHLFTGPTTFADYISVREMAISRFTPVTPLAHEGTRVSWSPNPANQWHWVAALAGARPQPTDTEGGTPS